MSSSTRPGSAIAKFTESSMRGTFYSIDENPGEQRIVESFKLSNVLELSEKEKSIISEIKRIMNEECERL